MYKSTCRQCLFTGVFMTNKCVSLSYFGPVHDIWTCPFTIVTYEYVPVYDAYSFQLMRELKEVLIKF